jgi:glycosyltransferase involved in cell wall biosynthesis
MPAGFARGVSAELTAEAERLAAAPGRARVIVDYLVPAGALLPLARRRPVVYNAHNLESAFRDQIEEGRPMRTLERFEERIIEQASESWMVSSADVEGARALVPGANIKYVPNVVDVAAIRPVKYPSGGRRALFVGNFEWAPNREAVRHLVDEVLPRLWEEMPEARLAIVGRGLDVPLSDDPRVEQFGFVPDLASVYARADCVVVPLLTSGGSPLKFVEALAYGVPVVATSTAAKGLEVKGGEHYLEADEPPAFARAVARSLRGEAAEIGARGRELAERAYSIESLVERVAP